MAYLGNGHVTADGQRGPGEVLVSPEEAASIVALRYGRTLAEDEGPGDQARTGKVGRGVTN